MIEVPIENENVEKVDSTLQYNSKILIINSKEVSIDDFLDRLLKEGVDNSIQNDDKHDDLKTCVLDVILNCNEGNKIATVSLDIGSTSKRINHSSDLKDYYRTSNSVLFVFNASSQASFDELTGLMNDYIVLSQRQDSALLLVGCKSNDQERGVSLEEILTWASVSRTKRSIAYIECCTSTGYGVTDIVAFMLKQSQSQHRKAVAVAAALEASKLIESSACGVADVPVKNTSFFLKEASSRSYVSNGEDEFEGNRWEELEQTMADSLSRDRRESCGMSSDEAEEQMQPEKVKSDLNGTTHPSLFIDTESSAAHSQTFCGKNSPRSTRNDIFAGEMERKQRASLTQEDLQQVRNIIEESFGYDDDFSGEGGHDRYRSNAQEVLRDLPKQENIHKQPSPRNGRGKLSRQHTGTTEVSVGDHDEGGEDHSEAAYLTGRMHREGGEKNCTDAMWCFLCF